MKRVCRHRVAVLATAIYGELVAAGARKSAH